jgi:hypothetical protein
MKQIVTLMNLWKECQMELAKVNEKASELNKFVRTIEEDYLPTVMAEFGLSEFKAEDGAAIKLKTDWFGSVPEARMEAAYEWLKERKLDAIVTSEVSLKFAAGGDSEDDPAAQAYELLAENGFDPNAKRSIHYQTLKAFVKERMEGGKELPMDLFGVYSARVAQIKTPKG